MTRIFTLGYASKNACQFFAILKQAGIESKADLARYLGVSRARVTQVLDRLVEHQHNTVETVNLTKN